jgi:hypothetical protein
MNWRRHRLVAAAVCIVFLRPALALGQSASPPFELGAQLAAVRSSEFEATDLGVGARFSWSPVGLLGLESEINFYPKGFPGQFPISRGRVEGLLGATVGPRVGSVRLFGKGRVGFLNVRPASQPFACILIFPPPLSCELGAGRTLLVFDVGGGLELFPTRRTFARVEIGDRVVKYPGPALARRGAILEHTFFSHDLRFAAGAGLRF